MNFLRRILLLLLSLSLAALTAYNQQTPPPSPEVQRLKGNRGGEMILASIKAMGGWETWKQKTDVQYEREMTRYEEDGRIIREKQFHRFVLPSAVRARLETVREGKTRVQGFDGTKEWVTEDGKLSSDPELLRGARRSAFGTQYMFCLPFKLTDAGARTEYLGVARLAGKAFDKVRVTYAPGTGETPEHIWTFYFHQTTHFLERVDWTDGKSCSITEHKNYRKVDGLWWPTARSNYMSDAQGNKKRKFSDLVYHNIHFNNEFNSSLFAAPR